MEVLLAYSKSGNGREAELVIDRMRQRNMDVSGKVSKQLHFCTNHYIGVNIFARINDPNIVPNEHSSLSLVSNYYIHIIPVTP